MLFQEMLLAARLMQLSTMISLQVTWQVSAHFTVSSEIFVRLLFCEFLISKLLASS